MPEVYWSNDVADYAHQTGHCCVPRHSSVHDGEATKGSQEPLSLLMEVPVLDQAIAGPIVLDCPEDQTVSIDAS